MDSRNVKTSEPEYEAITTDPEPNIEADCDVIVLTELIGVNQYNGGYCSIRCTLEVIWKRSLQLERNKHLY